MRAERRDPRSPTGALVNIGLLERELGSVEHRLWKLAAGDPARSELEVQKRRLLQALDDEVAKQALAKETGKANPGPPGI